MKTKPDPATAGAPVNLPSETDQVAQEILADMPLREKSAIAHMDETEIPYLQYAFDRCVSTQIGMNAEMSRDIMHRIWRELRATHRIRIIK